MYNSITMPSQIFNAIAKNAKLILRVQKHLEDENIIIPAPLHDDIVKMMFILNQYDSLLESIYEDYKPEERQ